MHAIATEVRDGEAQLSLAEQAGNHRALSNAAVFDGRPEGGAVCGAG